MIIHKTVTVKGGGSVEALEFPLSSKKLIVLKGSKGYIMCGYLNIETATRCKDAAAMITGVSSIEEALGATISAVTPPAEAIGIHTGQTVKDAIERII